MKNCMRGEGEDLLYYKVQTKQKSLRWTEFNTNENKEISEVWEILKGGFASEIKKDGHLWIPDLLMNEKAIKFQLEHEKYPDSDKKNNKS
jgi:hypothetical protein